MTNESKTLFIPLYGKAAMSREGIFKDITAEYIVESLPEEMRNVDTSRKLSIFMAMRASIYDDLTCNHPHHENMIAVHLGCGLDSRCERAGHAAKLWYDLDFPEVITVRKRYFQESDRCKMIASSIMDFSWMEQLDYRGEHIFFIMEGVSMYLSEADMKALFSVIQRKFGFCTFVFDAYTPLAAKFSKYKNPINNVHASVNFAMKDPLILETDNIRLQREHSMIKQEILDQFHGIERLRCQFIAKHYPKFYRMFIYAINQPS